MTLRGQFLASKPRSWRVHDWPIHDQTKWNRAFAKIGMIMAASTVARLGPRSRKTLEQAYGMFLDHVARVTGASSLVDQNRPAELLLPIYVESYNNELARRVGSVTQYESIAKLRRAARILDPERDFGWLQEIERTLASLRRPSDKRDRVVESQTLFAAGLRLIEHHWHGTTPMQAIKFRDGLMVALLTVCPIRLKIFAHLTIGNDFRLIGSNWWITLSAASTKTGRIDDRMVPAFLTKSINRYIDLIRPVLKPDGNSLWIGLSGQSLSYSSVQYTITKTTEDLMGVRVSPHLFRTCAATSAYVLAPHHPRLPSTLLHHQDQSVTQKHYNKAPAAGYARRFRQLVEA